MKSFKSFSEEMTFKVEVEGLPAMYVDGNSPGQVKSHLRKLIKQPSLIKSVKRQTKHDVKKMYRDKAQGKEVEEGTVDYGTDKSIQIMKKKTPGEAQENCGCGQDPCKTYGKMKEAGLWANIHAKRRRGERMRKKGEKGAPTPAAIKSAQKEDVTEKLTIGKIRRAAYKTGKALGDVQAVKKNKVARRVKNRIVGKLAAKALSGLFK
jgi:hypothetical protein